VKLKSSIVNVTDFYHQNAKFGGFYHQNAKLVGFYHQNAKLEGFYHQNAKLEGFIIKMLNLWDLSSKCKT
jgi:hypothetical protein